VLFLTKNSLKGPFPVRGLETSNSCWSSLSAQMELHLMDR